MTYFTFDTQALSRLEKDQRHEAELATATAKKLCEFYQYYARSLYEGHDDVKDVNFTQEEAALAGEIVKSKNCFTIPKSKTGLATMKLFYGSQIEFYRKNPDMNVLFGPNMSPLLLSMVYLNAVLPDTYEPIDRYFSDIVKQITVSTNDKSPPLLPPRASPD